ncbi:tetratricopeptide repeat protein [Bermanella sp. WJH001]|uniref:tetratricopeptide repeat protein n=1 Tax=Bermanella sp. WJH001 TaxID=3048005 RepID=UPI0024BEFBE2|nr:hypothetical protein [Bermanella sp. WJH001]MDJ1538695.1 hypothetical protein [Bermanella sp. WJH001]
MSVVNDILKDLHQRRRQHHYIPNIPFEYGEDDVSKFNAFKPYFIFIVLIIFISLMLYFAMLSFNSSQELSVEEDAINSLSTIVTDTITNDDDTIITLPTLVSSTEEKSAHINAVEVKAPLPVTDEMKPSYQPVLVEQKHNITKPLISEIRHTEAKKISNINKLERAKNSDVKRKANERSKEPVIKSIQNDELLIRKLMISQPEKVWPYIQKLLPKTNNKISLIAMGAQGEQRSKNHQNAIDLYKALAEIEPNEPKWRVGAAISFDALSKYDDALIEYQRSLRSNTLPAPLYSFVKQRITQLTGDQHER